MPEIGDVLRTAIVKNGEVRFRESGQNALPMAHYLHIHLYQRHAGSERGIRVVGLLGGRHIRQ